MSATRPITIYLAFVLQLCILVPGTLIGSILTWYLYSITLANSIDAVKQVADSRQQQLLLRLNEENNRVSSLLKLLSNCRYADIGINSCAKYHIEQFVSINSVNGIIFHSGTENDLIKGNAVVHIEEIQPFLPGQLAIITGSDYDKMMLSFVAIDPKSGFSLVASYPRAWLQNIFVSPKALGESGETFLANNKGMFFTSPRYPSQQGIIAPISATPMNHCLSGASGETMDLDYRGIPIIHGYRFISEIGGGCIMAHIDQTEAFAPARRLALACAFTLLLFLLLGWKIATIMGKRLSSPIVQLNDMAQAWYEGDYSRRLSVSAYSEVNTLSQLFNNLSARLDDTIGRLQHSEKNLERKVAERTIELDQKQRKYYSVIRTAADGFLHLDRSGDILESNPAYAKYSGYSETELVGMSIIDLEAIETTEEIVKHIQTVIEQGSDCFSSQHRRKDGSLWSVEVTVSYSNDAERGQFFAFFRDVTERKRQEFMLADTLNVLQTVLHAAPIRIFWKDRQSCYLGCNHLFARDSGHDMAANVIGKYDDQMAWQEHANLYRQDDNEVMETGTAKIGFEEPLITSNGRRIWLRTSKVPLRNSNDEIVGVLGVYDDITEVKRTQDTLQLSQAKLQESLAETQMLLESSLDAIIIMDEQGLVISWNHHAESLFGYTQDQAVGQELATLIVPPEQQELHRQGLAKYLNTETSVLIGKRLETYGVHQNGSKVQIELTIAAVANDTKHLFSAFIRDISERKQVETELSIAAVAFESQESMMITDADGVILRINSAFTESTGYTTEDVVGKTPRLLKSGRHSREFYFDMWKTLNYTGKWQGEIWDRRKNGEIFLKWLTITAVKDRKGNVNRFVAIHSDITERKATEEEIKNLAFFDPLTNLPNRRLLMDRLKHALVASVRRNTYGALLFIDMDNFKTLNDTLGHDKGDMLLQEVALRLTDCVRESDTVARLGGDEFIVLLEDLEKEITEAAAQSEIVGKKILLTLSQPYLLNSHQHLSTPSIGAVIFNGHSQTSADELLKQADIAMYQAKASGRNALRFFNQQMQATIMARTTLQDELHRAVLDNQFILYYQPQVCQNSQVIGAEALIRWLHPERGFILPAAFIALAEESDLILSIGHWVLKAACIQLKTWASDRHTQHLQLAVNVSARQFHHADFVDQVTRLIEQTSIDPTRLKLELTESMAIENLEETIDKMQSLRKVGVQFSMDDFGTGHSSLSNLKKLPIEQLKIDQSFVRDITSDPDDAVIVQTIIALAKNMGLEVIAEGVETEAQRLFLEQHGCQCFQGYLFSKPVPIEQFDEFISRT